MKKAGFYIEYNDWQKILYYAKARQSQVIDTGRSKKELDHEIGGMLIAKIDKEGDWILKDPVILKQETSGGNCVLDKTELADYYIEMAQKYGKNIQFVWWHSHAKMGPFWSGTDTTTMKEYASGQWSMFLVVNVKGEYKFRVQMWQPIEAGEDIELELLNAPENTIPKDIVKEVEAKCSEINSGYNGSVWTGKYKNNNQLSIYNNKYGTNYADSQRDIWAEKEELKDYNASYGVYNDEELAYDYLSDKIDSLNTKLCAGEIKHNQYRKSIKQLNKKINSGSYEFKIKIPKDDNALDSFIQTHFPYDFIVDKDTDAPYTNINCYGSIYD